MTASAPKLRADASIEKGTAVLERYSVLAGELAAIEENRASALASTNAVADGIAAPIVAEMQLIEQQLKPWWTRIADKVTGGKRKTAELGGCIIGTKAGSTSLAFALGDDQVAVASLRAAKWSLPFIRTTHSLDKVALKKALTGKHGDRLKALGFSSPAAPDAFILERVAQAGTIAQAQ